MHGKSGLEAARNGREEWYGDTFQNGVRPGPKKLAQFVEVLQLTGTPALYSQEGQGDDALVHVKFFDPSGSWTWFITKFDEKENVAFGLVDGRDTEVGYIDLNELANVSGIRRERPPLAERLLRLARRYQRALANPVRKLPDQAGLAEAINRSSWRPAWHEVVSF